MLAADVIAEAFAIESAVLRAEGAAATDPARAAHHADAAAVAPGGASEHRPGGASSVHGAGSGQTRPLASFSSRARAASTRRLVE